MPKAKWNDATTVLGAASPADVIDFCRGKKMQMVDFKFTDLPGTWQHFSMPADEVDEEAFTEGTGV